ncbi:hypothetical protein, partial [Brevundimonas sp.]|uniref:hypothetical protein n=1 Tax=Brevundimonas sp. TaxID=1871086 RepID=UPI00257FA116
ALRLNLRPAVAQHVFTRPQSKAAVDGYEARSCGQQHSKALFSRDLLAGRSPQKLVRSFQQISGAFTAMRHANGQASARQQKIFGSGVVAA